MTRTGGRSAFGRSRLLRPVALAMALIVAFVSMPVGAARAGLIGTDQVIGAAAGAWTGIA
jgi:hypothetical protein